MKYKPNSIESFVRMIEILLIQGWIDLDDINPIIKKGIAKMLDKEEIEIFKKELKVK